nr:hypothetical protein [Methanosarcina barkeri]
MHPEDLLLVELELEENCEEGGKEFNRQYRILTQTADVRWIDEKNLYPTQRGRKSYSFPGYYRRYNPKYEKSLTCRFKQENIRNNLQAFRSRNLTDLYYFRNSIL